VLLQTNKQQEFYGTVYAIKLIIDSFGPQIQSTRVVVLL
jgi:hypothetical protein